MRSITTDSKFTITTHSMFNVPGSRGSEVHPQSGEKRKETIAPSLSRGQMVKQRYENARDEVDMLGSSRVHRNRGNLRAVAAAISTPPGKIAII